jgi:hypothetical protein
MSGTSNANYQFPDALIRQGFMRKHVQYLGTNILLWTTQDPKIIDNTVALSYIEYAGANKWTATRELH